MGAGRLLIAGREALRRGRWNEARESFEAALAVRETPEALDGFGTALWWLNDPAAGLLARARAYAGYRRDGRTAEACCIAVWLSREYRSLFRNSALAEGWLARARGLAGASRTMPWSHPRQEPWKVNSSAPTEPVATLRDHGVDLR